MAKTPKTVYDHLADQLNALSADISGGWFGALNWVLNGAHYQVQYKNTQREQAIIVLENSMTGIHAKSDTAIEQAKDAAGQVEAREQEIFELEQLISWAKDAYKAQTNRDWTPPARGSKKAAPSADPQKTLDRIHAEREAAAA